MTRLIHLLSLVVLIPMIGSAQLVVTEEPSDTNFIWSLSGPELS